ERQEDHAGGGAARREAWRRGRRRGRRRRPVMRDARGEDARGERRDEAGAARHFLPRLSTTRSRISFAFAIVAGRSTVSTLRLRIRILPSQIVVTTELPEAA